MAPTMNNITNRTAVDKVGGVRRKMKRNPGVSSLDEKKLAAALQKLGNLQSVPSVDECVLSNQSADTFTLKTAKVFAATAANTLVLSAEEVVVNTAEAPLERTDTAAEEEGKTYKENKQEKKLRKAMKALGLKDVSSEYSGPLRLNTGNGIQLLVQAPDSVLKFEHKNGWTAFAVFGQVSFSEPASKEAQAKQLLDSLKANTPQGDAPEAEDESDDEDCPDLAEVTFDEASAVNEDDVQLVMQQAGVKRAAAVTALRDNDADVVNAIMSLSS